MTSPNPTLLQASVQAGGKFDRNAASRMLGQEFAALRQKYGDTAIRAAGFTPRTLAQMQAPLRALQMSNTSTLDAHQSAINDALAKLRSYNFGGSQAAPQAPVQAQRPAEPQGTLLPMPQMPQMLQMPEPERPMLQMPEPERPMPQPEGPMPQVPMTAQALVPYSPPSPPPKPFDRNAASRQFNQQFSTMFKTLGDSGFRTQGFTPRDLAQLQAGLRKLQMDNTSTPEQHQAALQNALNTLNSRVMMPVSQAPQM